MASCATWTTRRPRVPQAGERFEGVWVAEGTVTYDGSTSLLGVDILEFRGEKVAHESIYFSEPFEAPKWRAAP